MADSVSARALTLALLAILAAAPLRAQTNSQGGAAGAPADPAEANAGGIPPLRIGNVTLTGSFHGDASMAAGAADEDQDHFAVKRARVGFAGPLTSHVGWNVSAELTSTPVLRNAFVQVRLSEPFTIRIGQFTPPSAIERGTSPTRIEMIDRSRITRALTYTQDIGVAMFNTRPIARTFTYGVSVVNGSGFNRWDNNTAKDVVARVEARVPGVPDLIGVASAGRGTQPDGFRSRSSVGAQFDHHSVKLLVEALREHTRASPVRDGYLMTGVYRIHPHTVTPHFQMIEVTARFVRFTDPLASSGLPDTTPDEDAGGAGARPSFVPVTTRDLQAGGNYYMNRNVRFMVNALVPVDARTSPSATLVGRMQVVF